MALDAVEGDHRFNKHIRQPYRQHGQDQQDNGDNNFVAIPGHDGIRGGLAAVKDNVAFLLYALPVPA